MACEGFFLEELMELGSCSLNVDNTHHGLDPENCMTFSIVFLEELTHECMSLNVCLASLLLAEDVK